MPEAATEDHFCIEQTATTQSDWKRHRVQYGPSGLALLKAGFKAFFRVDPVGQFLVDLALPPGASTIVERIAKGESGFRGGRIDVPDEGQFRRTRAQKLMEHSRITLVRVQRPVVAGNRLLKVVTFCVYAPGLTVC